MLVAEMKEIILKAYKTDSWKRKVEKMSESQIIAVYYSFERSGTLARIREQENDAFMKRWNKAMGKPEKKPKPAKPMWPMESKQLSIDDYLKGKE